MRRVIIVSALALHIALVADGIWHNFATVDETAMIAAGMSHWETGSYVPYRVNPPLPRMIAVLPLFLVEANSAESSKLAHNDVPGRRTEWAMTDAFAEANRDRFVQVLRAARLNGIAWSLLGAWVVYRWGADLYGPRASCLGLVLWCVGPNLIAHAQLATPDVPASVVAILAGYVCWTYLRRPSWLLAALTGVLIGVCLLTKFTALILCAVWSVLWLLYRPWRVTGMSVALTQGALIPVISLMVVNVGYNFTNTGQRLADYRFVSRAFGGDAPSSSRGFEPGSWGNRFEGTWIGRVVVPLPEDYLRGIDVQKRDFELLGKTMPSYLAGEWSERGWWYYYVYALAVKVPLGVWALVVWNAILIAIRHRSVAPWRDELALWLPAGAVLVTVSSELGFNHHMRYVLPLFPFVIVSVSKLAFFLEPGRWGPGLVVVLLVSWTAVNTILTRPHHLSYFNEAAGGPENGHKHLLSSNIDWGQDLLHLKDWIDRNPQIPSVQIAYCNLIDPGVIGIRFTPPPYGPTQRRTDSSDRLHPKELGPRPGYYAVSVNYLYGFSFPMPDGSGGRTSPPPGAYEYFRHFRPVAKAGYSLFIYDISLDEANRVRQLYKLPPLVLTDRLR